MANTINIKEEWKLLVESAGFSWKDGQKALADFARRCCEMQREIDLDTKNTTLPPLVTIVT
jgi:hypothetical protein